jgi:uncharacterized RDD family membrane protein YckC
VKEHSLLSPEKVYLDLDLAGVGSRFAACFIDGIFIDLLMIFIVIFGIGLAGISLALIRRHADFSPTWLIAAVILLVSVILFGYFIFFETIWSGQTPGKRLLKIRVVQDNGSPVTFFNVLIRNILRIVDVLPFAYAIGIIAILISKKNQRLGDLAAGAVVVRENVAAAPAAIDYEVVEQPWSGTARLHIHEISESEFAVLKTFLLRRGALRWDEARDYEQKLALFFSHKLGLDPDETGHPSVFLEQVAALYQRR